MKQSAVVTGANGLIGRSVVKALLQRGIPTVAVDHLDAQFECPFLKADLTQPGALDEVLTRETVVFHLAARTSVSGSVKAPRDDFDVNVMGTLEVLESVRRAQAALVFPSSSSVYDPSSPLPHKETAPKRPSSPYGAGKLACEAYCYVYHACYGLKIRVARLFNAYGPGMTRFAIYDFYHKIRAADDHIAILGDGRQIRDFLYVDDVAAGLLTIADKGLPGEDYNLASGQPTNILSLARMMAEIMGKPHLQLHTTGSSFEGDVEGWYADLTKTSALGFKPTVSLRDGLMATLEWLETTAA
jgi:UDP-glucose 4-epimerase